MRTQTHIIDTKAVKAVMAQLPDHWVIRELSERDYGIDLMIEIFRQGAQDAKGKEAFEATGAVFHIQIKGTEKKLKPGKKGTINYAIGKKSLLYVEKFSSPFFLFRVSVAEPVTIYIMWLQRYIKDVMDVEERLWREESGNSITLRIPKSNKLQANLKKLEDIAFRPKYLEELVEYRELYQDLCEEIEAIRASNIVNHNDIDSLKNLAWRIRRLNTLLTRNELCIDKSCVDDLIYYIEYLDIDDSIKQKFPHRDHFDLLESSLNQFSLTETFLKENTGLSVY